jgi:4-carboxymuconolactone decarboxylase
LAPLDDLTEDEALIIGYGRELLETKQVSDATVEAVRKRYGEKGLLELTAVMGVYTMNATILRAMAHPAPPGARTLTPRK